MVAAFVGQVCEHFEKITDPRINRGRNYPLLEMIFVALCGAICDCNAWTDVATFGKCKLDWFRKFFPFENGVPSHDTFSEVFARLDTVELYAALESWAREMAVSLRRRNRRLGRQNAARIFRQGDGQVGLAFGLRMGLWLEDVPRAEVGRRQIKRDSRRARTDRHARSPGAVVTADAMHCQTETAERSSAKKRTMY